MSTIRAKITTTAIATMATVDVATITPASYIRQPVLRKP